MITKMSVILALFLPSTVSAELIVFKRYSDHFEMPSAHIDHTVWVLDAPNIVLDPINDKGRNVVDPKAQAEFVEQMSEEVNTEQMRALVIYSFIGKAKANEYGVTTIPSAVQVDRDGTVVRILEGRFAIQRFLGELDDL